MLVEADVVRGRSLTSWPSLRTDIRNAGGEWKDEQVVVDHRLVTSRKPDDLDEFCAKLVEVFGADGSSTGTASGRRAQQYRLGVTGFRAHIGCSGWNYASWKGTVYDGAPASQWLSLYSQWFDTVEVNSTFYRLPTAKAVEALGRLDPGRLSFRSQGEQVSDACQAPA